MLNERKKYKKIVIALILSIVMQIIFPTLSIEALAVDSDAELTRNYEIKKEETWDVSKNQDGSVMAKWTLENRTLTITGTGELKNWSGTLSEDKRNAQISAIEKVVIEKGITSIGEYAFNNCSNLISISIPNSVTKIEMCAFSGCSSLSSIEIPKEVTSIGDSAFSGCSTLSSITIPEGITMIGSSTFSGCSSLESINIPNSVTKIGMYAFAGCNSLSSITIPEKVTNIESSVFPDCNNLISIEVSEYNKNYISENGILLNKNKTEILQYPAGKKDTTYAIPEGITNIGNFSFSGCSTLSKISIPAGVTNIGNGAFYKCSSLNNIYIPKGITNMGAFAFYECSSLNSINIPSSVVTIGNDAFDKCSNLTSINIPITVTKIGSNAIPETTIIYTQADSEGHRYAEEEKQGYILNGEANKITTTYQIEKKETWDISKNQDESVIARLENKTLTITGTGAMKDWQKDSKEYWNMLYCTRSVEEIVIEEGVTSIGSNAFYGYTNLKSINIPEGITDIGENAFNECSNLSSIQLPNSVISIENSAFSGCSSLSSIQLPGEVVIIGSDVFSGCNNLASIEVSENNQYYVSENGVLFNKNKTEIRQYPAGKRDSSYAIPEGITSIGKKAFSDCNNLNTVTIPSSVTNIKDNAFWACSNLSSITIPNSVTNIGMSTFAACNNLKSINIPSSVTSIGSSAISGTTIIYTKSNSEGHRYAEESKQGYIIDEEGPEVVFETKGNNQPSKKQGTKVTVTDIGVGVKETKYKWEQSTIELEEEDFTENFDNETTIEKTEEDGEWYLWILAKDELGNTTITRSEVFVLDNTAPTTQLNYSTTEATDQKITVTVTANEPIQEIEGWTLSEDKLTLTREYSENIMEEVTIKDLAENETKMNVQITNIVDEKAPTVETNYKVTGQKVIVTITANEQIQEIEGWTLSEDRLSLTKEYSENMTEKITVKDLAGNETNVNITVSDIEKEPENEVKKGDLNKDGKIDTTDLIKMLRHISASQNSQTIEKYPGWILTGDNLEIADINDDGKIDTTDMLRLLRHIATSKSEETANQYPSWILP